MEKSCGVVVFRKQGEARLYLLLHYSEGHWDLPKGHVERGESEEETARREVEEETGIAKLDILQTFREVIEYSFRRRGGLVPKEVVYFLGCTGSESVRLSHEHIGFEWLPYQSALRRLTYANARRVLMKAEGSLSEEK
jgi:8-oxo-dGTP pyrophosphatase MutT (NUDIX family)